MYQQWQCRSETCTAKLCRQDAFRMAWRRTGIVGPESSKYSIVDIAQATYIYPSQKTHDVCRKKH